jgi:hypothetical protein
LGTDWNAVQEVHCEDAMGLPLLLAEGQAMSLFICGLVVGLVLGGAGMVLAIRRNPERVP